MENQNVYILWGIDFFSKERYYCGKYYTLEKAEDARLRKMEEVREYMDEELMDRFYVQEASVDEVLQAQKLQEQIESERDSDKQYDYHALKSTVNQLVEELRNKVKALGDKDLGVKGRVKQVFSFKYKNPNPKDCYCCITCSLLAYKTGELGLDYKVEFKNAMHLSGGSISSVIVLMPCGKFKRHLSSSKFPNDILSRTLRFINDFYERD